MSKRASHISRRMFLGSVGTAAISAVEGNAMLNYSTGNENETSLTEAKGIASSKFVDGPPSSLFSPIPLKGNFAPQELELSDLSETLRKNIKHAPSGQCVSWGIPFTIDKLAVARKGPLELKWPALQSPWLIFMHTTDMAGQEMDSHKLISAPHGPGLLGELVADYVILYADGSEKRLAIRRQFQVGMMSRSWGINCFEAVAHQKPYPVRPLSEQPQSGTTWGETQYRLSQPDAPPWVNWLWAWQNPYPEKALAGMRIEPKAGTLLLSGLTAGRVSSTPLRWDTRRKAILGLPEGIEFDPDLTSKGLSRHLQLDLGQVISALPQAIYPNESWDQTYNNKPPELSRRELLVEYTAHCEASFHFPDGSRLPVSAAEKSSAGQLTPIAPASQRVRLRVVEKESGKPVAIKLHIHGEGGEYLAPVDRHRIPNPYWYEDWSVDYFNPEGHFCTYVPGETSLDLPLGQVYLEISKGFEIAPLRKKVKIEKSTTELEFKLERILPWRERGWVTADTHVHFLSPSSAQLEGAGEGVNVVNLLASQWGELMTNVGDFDGKTTFGSREAGGEGEYLVRVGTENRQHVLGHISLLGYNGSIIAPMTTGGPDESALGDPVEILLTEWARQCRKQGGIVVLPHFPNPRAEHAAAIVGGDIDAVEMTSWSNLYGGIDPYSLADWYRYLNCGYFVAAVGGTDKMQAKTAVGAVRTYAKLPPGIVFDYETWKTAVRSGHTFVTYGPLMEYSVEGKPPGARLTLNHTGGTLNVEWKVASVTIPMTRVDLVVNGEIQQSRSVNPREDAGSWPVKVNCSSWIALLVRGNYPDKWEIITAHSSPVMVEVEGTPFFAAADAVTILDQIEGAMAYLDTVGTRAETGAYKRMRLVLQGAHRAIHNRLHQRGVLHEHTPAEHHEEHRSSDR